MSAERGKRLVTLALNVKLRKQIATANTARTYQRPGKVENDKDYYPTDSESESNSDSDLLSASGKSSYIASKSTSTANKVIILQHVVIPSSLSYNSISKDAADYILEELLKNVYNEIDRLSYTKQGTLRQRKKFAYSVHERQEMKKLVVKSKHVIKASCKCTKNCGLTFRHSTRLQINSEFWTMSPEERKTFIKNSVDYVKKKKTTTANVSRRQNSCTYHFKNKDGLTKQVCKTSFLTTLGFKPSNDKMIRNILKNQSNRASILATPDNRKGNKRPCKINRDIVREHIESFHPQVSHYRREHAPLRKYLPSDITIQFMYDDFQQKNPNMKCSYNSLYREEVAKLNISFTKLGHEECWGCELFLQHGKVSNHSKNNLDENCEECKKWIDHRVRYTSARKEYQEDAEHQSQKKLVVTADLQKVIMLPRCDTLKEVLFAHRLVAFNESFVPAGKKNAFGAPTAVIWHEAIRGRSKEDLISAFYAYFLSQRDREHIILWLDNCAAQNKNWALFSFFVYLMNCEKISLKILDVKYFESGHTFMAADSYHHQVEKALNQKGKVFDFDDYKDAVKNAAKNGNVIQMNIHDFYQWKDCSSQYKLRKVVPRAYLHDMVQVTFRAGSKDILYNTSFDKPSTSLNFLNAESHKQGILEPKCRTIYKGFSVARKNDILSKIIDIMPPSRRIFWQNLPEVSGDVSDED